MGTQRWLTKALIISLICVTAFAFVAYAVTDHDIRYFDSAVIAAVQGWEAPGLTSVMLAFSWIGSTGPVAVITIAAIIILYTVLHHRRELIFLGALTITSALMNTLVKSIFHRTRPTLHRIAEANGFSFPSGHAMATIALYGGLAFLLWKHAPAFWGRALILILSIGFIVMIGLSRIYLGVHFPSDVLGGYLFSGSLLAIFIWYYQRYLDKISKRQRGNGSLR